MVDFELPSYLVGAVDEATGPTRHRLREWLTELPERVVRLAAEWSLELGRPYQPGGRTAWVAPVTAADGRHLVLKVGWSHDESRHEAAGLQAWDGAGTVRLISARDDDETTSLLIEACEPGQTLTLSADPEHQDEAIGAILRRLRLTPTDGHPFRTLTSMCDAWADEWEVLVAEHGLPAQLPADLAATGIALFRELPRTATDERLLCTDLHADNVLSAFREPWLVIDPKPYVGDPAYDVVQHMLNQEPRLQQDPVALTVRMAALMGLDAVRVRQWLFARCVQEAPTWPAMAPVAVRLAPSTS